MARVVSLVGEFLDRLMRAMSVNEKWFGLLKNYVPLCMEDSKKDVGARKRTGSWKRIKRGGCATC